MDCRARRYLLHGDTPPQLIKGTGTYRQRKPCCICRCVVDPQTPKEHRGEVETGSGRSLAPIDIDDLLRLARLATEVEAGLFARRPQGAGRYAGRLICRALCQGAALHYLDGRTGVKDFDVWSFYAAHDDGEFPPRWRKQLTSVPRSSGVTRAIRHRSRVVGWTSWDARWTCHPTQSRYRSCAAIFQPHAPTLRANSRRRRSSSSAPSKL